MLIDNKYTTKHPCITANYNMYQPHTGKRDRHAPDIDFMFTLNQGKVEREHEVSLSH